MFGTKLELEECELFLLSLFLIAGTEWEPRSPDFQPNALSRIPGGLPS